MNYRTAVRLAFFVVSLLTPLHARAQACPASPGPTPCYDEACCDPSLNGNPVHMTRAATFYRHRDFTVAAPGGDFEFLRTFTSDPTKWTYWTPQMFPMLAGVPVPFGNAQSGSPLYIGGPMRWVHNLFSVVYDTPTGTSSPSAGIYVRDMGGGLAQFAKCVPSTGCWGAGGWAAPHPQAPATYGKVRVINYSSFQPTGYEYTQPNGVVLILDKQYGSTNYYFLRKALNPARQTWFEIVYYESPEVVPNCPTPLPTGLLPTGVPYIKEVRLDPAGGASPALQFNYSEVVNITPGKACLLTSVKYRSTAGTDTSLVSYGYHQDGGASRASLRFIFLTEPLPKPTTTALRTTFFGAIAVALSCPNTTWGFWGTMGSQSHPRIQLGSSAELLVAVTMPLCLRPLARRRPARAAAAERHHSPRSLKPMHPQTRWGASGTRGPSRALLILCHPIMKNSGARARSGGSTPGTTNQLPVAPTMPGC